METPKKILAKVSRVCVRSIENSLLFFVKMISRTFIIFPKQYATFWVQKSWHSKKVKKMLKLSSEAFEKTNYSKDPGQFDAPIHQSGDANLPNMSRHC